MNSSKRNIAIVLAGGSGSRFGHELPKQFFKINGRSIIEYSIEAFEKSGGIAEVWIVMNPLHLAEMQSIVNKNSWKKVTKLISGGDQRTDSTFNAVNACDSENVNLIFHDAARPCVSLRIIEDTVKALDRYEAVAVAVPATDTIFNVGEDTRLVREIPKRSMMYMAQTPQAFSFNVIREAYQRYLADPQTGITDDCGMVKRYLPEVEIAVVAGDRRNIKLTTREDVVLLEHYLHD